MKERSNQDILTNAINLAKVGISNLKAKRYETARTFLECVKQELEAKDGSLISGDNVGVIYQEALDYLSGVCIKLNDLDDAFNYLDSSFNILKQLEEENKESALLLVKYASTFDKFGVINEKQENYEKAIGCYQKVVVLANNSLKLTASVEAYDLMALAYYRIATIDPNNVNKDMIQSCVSVWSQLKEMGKNSSKYQMLLERCEKVLKGYTLPDLDTYEILNLEDE